jgi:hypothetical protein
MFLDGKFVCHNDATVLPAYTNSFFWTSLSECGAVVQHGTFDINSRTVQYNCYTQNTYVNKLRSIYSEGVENWIAKLSNAFTCEKQGGVIV